MKNIKHILHIVIFTAILALVLSGIGNILNRKYSRQKHCGFLEQKVDYDVLFLGTSHVINGINPMELYKEYGISSYNLSNHGCPMALTYWVMMNAFEIQEPKLVVVDLYGLRWEDKLDKNTEYAHDALDGFPLTLTKWKSAWDLFDTVEDRMQLAVPFAKYHGRWNEIDKKDFILNNNFAAGWQFRMGISADIQRPDLPDESLLPEKRTLSMDYLEKLVNECRSREIDVLLCYIPCAEKTEYQVSGNFGYVLSEKYGINYLNLAKDETLVNYGTDFGDSDGHLNPSGARKVTSAMGKFIKDNYDVADCRLTESAVLWSGFYETYFKSYIANTQARKTVYEYLMMLNNVNLEAEIHLSDDIDKNSHPLLFELIDNLKEGSLITLERLKTQDGADIEIVVRRKDTGAEVGKKSYKLN